MEQVDLACRYVTLQQPEHGVMRPGMELDGDWLIRQRTGAIMLRLWPDHQRLAGHGGTQPDDLDVLFTLIGPTDLTFFLSPVDGDLPALEWHVAEDRVDLFRTRGAMVNL